MSEFYNILKEIHNILTIDNKIINSYDDLDEYDKKLLCETEKSIILLFSHLEINRSYSETLELFREILNDRIHDMILLFEHLIINFKNNIINKKYLLMIVINNFITKHYAFEKKITYEYDFDAY